jgi:hypothetical protein
MFCFVCFLVPFTELLDTLHICNISWLRVKGRYMFRALLAHSQEALHKRHLVYSVRVVSVRSTRIEVDSTHINAVWAERTQLLIVTLIVASRQQ